MQELNIDVRQWGQPEGIVENIKHSLTLKLPEIGIVPFRHDGTFVICGSGPSIENHIDEIRADKAAGKTICGIKGAYDFLRGHDITPDVFISVEPRYRPIRKPHKDTAFLLSSRVDRQLFDELVGNYCVYLWHSWSEQDESEELIRGKIAIGGGTTSGLRAINVAYLQGFRKFKMYGMDSCLNKIGEKRIGQGPIDKSVQTTDVIVGNYRFTCNMAMAAQAQDFQSIWEVMPDIHVEVAGNGLLAAIIEERKKKNLPT